MDIETLKTFLAIEQTRHFTQAAQNLFCTQAAISMRIKRLEKALNCQLFERSGRSITLTPEGKILLPYAKQMVNTWQEASHHLLQSHLLEDTDIHISSSSTPGTYIMPSIIYQFQNQYPALTVINHVQYTRNVIDAILSGEFILGIVSQPLPIKHKLLSCKPLMDDPLVLVVHPHHPWAQKKAVSLCEIQSQILLVSNKKSSLVNYLEKSGNFSLNTNQIHICGNIEAIKQSIYKEQGVSVLSRHAVAQELKLGLLKEVPTLEHIHLSRKLYLIQSTEQPLKLSTQLFISFLSDFMTAHT